MPCTNVKPCLQPMLRWVHSSRCKKLIQERKEKLNQAERDLRDAAWNLGLLYSGDAITKDPDQAKMEARNKLIETACAYYKQRQE